MSSYVVNFTTSLSGWTWNLVVNDKLHSGMILDIIIESMLHFPILFNTEWRWLRHRIRHIDRYKRLSGTRITISAHINFRSAILCMIAVNLHDEKRKKKTINSKRSRQKKIETIIARESTLVVRRKKKETLLYSWTSI